MVIFLRWSITSKNFRLSLPLSLKTCRLFHMPFLHSDFMHLAGNMLFLWVFGDNVEDALGHIKFLIFYLLCAVIGGLAHGVLDFESTAPLIGASGAVAGIIGAYLMLHPRVWVWVLALGRIPLRLPAGLLLIFWIGLQIFMVVVMSEDSVSWAAHIGGFFCGILLVLFMRRRGVLLFDRSLQNEPVQATLSVQTNEKPWGAGINNIDVHVNVN
ncbi:Rhomboid protein 1, mitochondrial [Nymphon striatum]|nr:Rhomboid protein 1, mitochondrial [Nymphon striatum]